MAAAAGRRGDTRREPELAEAYDIEKSMFNGLLAVSLRERSSVQFFKSYRVKLFKKLAKLEQIGARLLKLSESRRSEYVLMQSDLTMLRAKGEAKVNEVDSLLVSMGVRVDDLEWNGSVSESSRGSSGRRFSDCFDAHQVSRVPEHSLAQEQRYPGFGHFQFPVLPEQSTREFSFRGSNVENLDSSRPPSVPYFRVDRFGQESDYPPASGGFQGYNGSGYVRVPQRVADYEDQGRTHREGMPSADTFSAGWVYQSSPDPTDLYGDRAHGGSTPVAPQLGKPTSRVSTESQVGSLFRLQRVYSDNGCSSDSAESMVFSTPFDSLEAPWHQPGQRAYQPEVVDLGARLSNFHLGDRSTALEARVLTGNSDPYNDRMLPGADPADSAAVDAGELDLDTLPPPPLEWLEDPVEQVNPNDVVFGRFPQPRAVEAYRPTAGREPDPLSVSSSYVPLPRALVPGTVGHSWFPRRQEANARLPVGGPAPSMAGPLPRSVHDLAPPSSDGLVLNPAGMTHPVSRPAPLLPGSAVSPTASIGPVPAGLHTPPGLVAEPLAPPPGRTQPPVAAAAGPPGFFGGPAASAGTRPSIRDSLPASVGATYPSTCRFQPSRAGVTQQSAPGSVVRGYDPYIVNRRAIQVPSDTFPAVSSQASGPPGLASVPLRNAPLSSIQTQGPMVTVSAGPLDYVTKPLAPVGSLPGAQGPHLGDSDSPHLPRRYPTLSGGGVVDGVLPRSALRGSDILRTDRDHSQVLREGFPSNADPVPEHLRNVPRSLSRAQPPLPTAATCPPGFLNQAVTSAGTRPWARGSIPANTGAAYPPSGPPPLSRDIAAQQAAPGSAVSDPHLYYPGLGQVPSDSFPAVSTHVPGPQSPPQRDLPDSWSQVPVGDRGAHMPASWRYPTEHSAAPIAYPRVRFAPPGSYPAEPMGAPAVNDARAGSRREVGGRVGSQVTPYPEWSHGHSHNPERAANPTGADRWWSYQQSVPQGCGGYDGRFPRDYVQRPTYADRLQFPAGNFEPGLSQAPRTDLGRNRSRSDADSGYHVGWTAPPLSSQFAQHQRPNQCAPRTEVLPRFLRQEEHKKVASLPEFLQSRLGSHPPPTQCVDERATSQPYGTLYDRVPPGRPSSEHSIASHLMELELLRNTLVSFSGEEPQAYRPWMNKMQAYMKRISDISPLNVLQILEGHTSGEPQQMIRHELGSPMPPSWDTVAAVYSQLDEQYGSRTSTAAQLLKELNNFRAIKSEHDGVQLQKLARLCKSIVDHQHTCPDLLNLNFSLGLAQARRLLPQSLQSKWADIGQEYEDSNEGRHPEFWIFQRFIQSCANKRSNPNYGYVVDDRDQKLSQKRVSNRVLKTTVSDCVESDGSGRSSTTSATSTGSKSRDRKFSPCPLHPDVKETSHSIYKCKKLRRLSYPDKVKLVVGHKLCLICLKPHPSKECDADIKCYTCGGKHLRILHNESSTSKDGGEGRESKSDS